MKAEIEKLYALSLAKKGVHITSNIITSKHEKRSHYGQSDAQKRLWLIENLDPGNATYNMPFAFRLRASLNIDLLEKSFNSVIARHEILRTIFDSIDEEPVQIIQDAMPITIRVVSLDTEEEGDAEFRAKEIINNEAQQAFDLRQGPLIRVTAIKISVNEFVVLVVLHHIVGDAKSFDVLLSEVAEIYDSLERDKPFPLLPLALQYTDFSEWMKENLTGNKLNEQLAFWQDYLNGAPNTLNLPVDFPRHMERTQAGASKTFELPDELTAKVQAVGRDTGSTIFMVCLAAFKALMSRYTNSDDLVVGTPISNRNREELKPLIGFFVNTLALRTDLSCDPSFGEILSRVRESTLAAFAHQDLPFDYLVEQLDIKRRSTEVPLINTMFSFNQSGLENPPPNMEPMPVAVNTAKFDLSMEVVKRKENLALHVEYATDLLEGTTIDYFIQHYIRLLDHGVSSPDTPLSQLRVQGEAEYQTITEQWSKGKELALPDGNVRDWMLEQLRTRGNALALADQGEELSYQQLHERIKLISQQLLTTGIKPGDVVAVYMKRSTDLIVSMAAIVNCGAAFLLLDVRYPENRLSYIVQDAGAKIVLSHSEDAAKVPPEIRDRCITINDEVQCQSDVLQPQLSLGGDDLAYVVYTSGSTGKPKGVEITHAGLANLVKWQQSTFKLSKEDRASQIMGAAFDGFMLDTWAYLCIGASVHIVNDETRVSPRYLIRWLDEKKITVAAIPSPLMESMFDEFWPECKSLRFILTGGDTLHRNPPASLPCKLYNLYGPTENTVVSTYKEVSPFVAMGIKPSIGRPIANHRAFVLDAHRGLVSAGVVGELYVGGPGLARGYRNNTELTAQAFVEVAIPGEVNPIRLYRTGDQAKLLANGEIDFIGRSDRQINIRGFRIELAEIEANLFEYESIARAAVIAAQADSNNAHLIAFLEAVESQQLSISQVRDFLQNRLPAFALPSSYQVLTKLPVTANGKIDYDALELAANKQETAFVAPSSPTEEIVAGIWNSILGREVVGVEENFFSLGGHSLLAAKVITRMNRVFKIDIPIKAIFDEPTVSALARGIDGNKWGGKGGSSVPHLTTRSQKSASTLRAETSFPQQRLLFLELLDPQTSTYNVPSAHKINGPLNIQALQFAFDQLVARHEILRTIFGVDENFLYYQQISSPRPVNIIQTNLEAVPDAQKATHVQLFLDEVSSQPFDLIKGPLFRVNLIKTAHEEHVLLMNMHHIITDGWSMDILYSELSEFYDAFCESRVPQLAPLAFQYGDFAEWQTNWLRFGVLITLRKYWENTLQGAPAEINLPTDRPRRPNQSLKGDLVGFSIDNDMRKQLRGVANENHVTLFMVLLGAFNVLLAKYSGQSDIVVGTPTANRKLEDLEHLIGFFVNMLPMRSDLSGNPTFRELLERVREVALGAYEHQDLPFDQMVEQVSDEIRWHRSPIFQVAFLLQHAQENPVKLQNLVLEPMGVENKTSKMDLTLSMQVARDRIDATFEYNVDLFDRMTIIRMASHFDSLLRQLMTDIDRPIADIHLVTPQERELITSKWSQGPSVEKALVDVCTQFEQQSSSTPGAQALSHNGQVVSYQQLNTQANQLADHLITLGIADDEVIAVALPRSIQMIGCDIAIWKAGAAFVNLDLEQPIDRLLHIVATAGARKVITTRDALDHLPPAEENIQYLTLDTLVECLASASKENPGLERSDKDLAYVNATSGSTGVPKCVEIPHSALANMVHAMQSVLHINDKDKCSQIASPAFDAVAFEVWPYLSAGACVDIIDSNIAKSPEELIEALVEQKITVAYVPTAILEICFGLAWPKKTRLKRVYTGGAALKKCPPPGLPFTVYNMYGPTENTVVSTYARVPDVGQLQGLPLIGKPLPGTTAYVLDDGLNPVPEGVVGEIYLGGASLARGYRNSPEQTAQEFIISPFNGEERLYKTGDRARYRHGELDFQGRWDDQINIRGYRIELGDITSAIVQQPQVEEAFVTFNEVKNNPILVAYVVKKPEVELTDDQLLAALKLRLPTYMLPNTVLLLNSLPKNASGKVDVSQLPIPDMTQQAAQVPMIPIVEEQDKVLAQIWSDVLNYEPVSLAENFFEQGGHSILALTLKSEIRKKFGVEIRLAQLFEDATLQHLSKLVRESNDIFDVNAEYFTLPETSSKRETARFMDKLRSFILGDPQRNINKSNKGSRRFRYKATDVLVPLQSEGTNSPIYCIHPISGAVMPYIDLANALGANQPVYGLQFPKVNDEQGKVSIEHLATTYAEAIRRTKVSGSVHLVGWSLGGVIAFEMARYLSEQGIALGELTLIDSFPADQSVKSEPLNERQLLANFLYDMVMLHGGDSQPQFDIDSGDDAVTGSELELCLQELKKYHYVPSHFPSDELQKKWKIYKTNYMAWSTYIPKQYGGKVNLIIAAQELSKHRSKPLKAWGKYSSGGLSIEVIPASHYSVVQGENAALVAAKIKESLLECCE